MDSTVAVPKGPRLAQRGCQLAFVCVGQECVKAPHDLPSDGGEKSSGIGALHIRVLSCYRIYSSILVKILV